MILPAIPIASYENIKYLPYRSSFSVVIEGHPVTNYPRAKKLQVDGFRSYTYSSNRDASEAIIEMVAGLFQI